MEKQVPLLAIFVDFASLLSMSEPLGIARYNFRGIFEVLTRDVIEGAQFIRQPLCVIPYHLEKSLKNPLENAGFEVSAASTLRSIDDNIIRSEIDNLPPQTTHILLITGDGGYLPFLQRKKESGVEIHILGTQQTGFRGNKSIADSYLDGYFKFVELLNFKNKIMAAPLTGSKHIADVESIPDKRDIEKSLSMRMFDFSLTCPFEEQEALLRVLHVAISMAAKDHRISVRTEIGQAKTVQSVVAKISFDIPSELDLIIFSFMTGVANMTAFHPTIRYRVEVS